MSLCNVRRALAMKITKIGQRGKLSELQRKLQVLAQSATEHLTETSEARVTVQQVGKPATLVEREPCRFVWLAQTVHVDTFSICLHRMLQMPGARECAS